MKQICRLFIVVSFLFNVVSAVVAQTMYWTDLGTDKIQRANLDGSNVQDLVTHAQGLHIEPAGTALDLGSGKMYWTNLLHLYVFNGGRRAIALDNAYCSP